MICEGDSHPGGSKCRDVELSLRANVEQTATKSNEHRQAGKNQRRRIKKGVADAHGPGEGAAEKQTVSLDRVITDDQDQNPGHNKGGHYGN